jgi:membrane-bound ClpP family serine protease
MSLTVIAVLIIVGLLFLLLEILVVPGTTVVGITGFILIAVGIWQSYAVYGATTGHFVLLISFVLTAIALALALRSKTWKRVMLDTTIDGKANTFPEESVKEGDTGKAISRIVPIGKALINDQYYEVRSDGEFIDQGTNLIVTKVDRNKIFVKPNK